MGADLRLAATWTGVAHEGVADRHEVCTMRISPADYLSLPLRAHELLHAVPLYDVSMAELPGGGPGRSVADVRALDTSASPSRIVAVIYGVRHLLGRAFGWDHSQIRPEDSLVSRLTERDRADSEAAPGSPDGAFSLVYLFPREALSEIRTGVVEGYFCAALVPTGTGYRLFWAVYVRSVSWITRPYLLAIEPVRRLILYPVMLRRIRRAWIQRYGDADGRRGEHLFRTASQ
jgi:Protein of unknown function (DUF2867)